MMGWYLKCDNVQGNRLPANMRKWTTVPVLYCTRDFIPILLTEEWHVGHWPTKYTTSGTLIDTSYGIVHAAQQRKQSLDIRPSPSNVVVQQHKCSCPTMQLFFNEFSKRTTVRTHDIRVKKGHRDNGAYEKPPQKKEKKETAKDNTVGWASLWLYWYWGSYYMIPV